MGSFTRSLSTIACLILLSACGGGGGNSSPAPAPPTNTSPPPPVTTIVGRFIDSAVTGLQYDTDTQSGLTNANGEFEYVSGETISFSLGGISFPTINAKTVITPLDIFTTEDYANVSVINMARLLQTLDSDGDLSNGINISEQAQQFAAGLTLTFDDPDFDNKVADLIANSGSVNTSLIEQAPAITHLQQTVNGMASSACESSHPKVGTSGEFMTFSHNVSGTATIINDCTIEIVNFNYDGGGPVVSFYAGTDGDYLGGFSVSENIAGQTFSNQTITIVLPRNRTLDDFNGISVWCEEFLVNFGDVSL